MAGWEEGCPLPRGRLVECVGMAGDLLAETNGLLVEHGIDKDPIPDHLLPDHLRCCSPPVLILVLACGGGGVCERGGTDAGVACFVIASVNFLLRYRVRAVCRLRGCTVHCALQRWLQRAGQGNADEGLTLGGGGHWAGAGTV